MNLKHSGHGGYQSFMLVYPCKTQMPLLDNLVISRLELFYASKDAMQHCQLPLVCL